MIAGSLVTTPAFTEPGLIWRELKFRTEDRLEMATTEDPLGPARVTLPLDLTGAVPKRRSEFLAGRLCAALALRAAGMPIELERKGRAPVWPAGVAGTISHNDSCAIAVVSRTHRRLGVDCETIMPPEQATTLQTEILTPAEAALRPEHLPFATFLTLVFSAKETLYKALSIQLTDIPGFLDANMTGLVGDSVHLSFEGCAHQVRFKLRSNECLTLLAVHP